MYEESPEEAALLLDEIDGHEVQCTPAQDAFVRSCRRRLAAGRLNPDDSSRLEDILDDLDHRAEYGDGYDDYDDDFADASADDPDRWEASDQWRERW